jgi:hypothetical protein
VTVGRISTTHAQEKIGAAVRLLDAAQGETVVRGTAQVAAVAVPLRSLERAAALLRLAAAEVENEMLQLRDGWPIDG